MDNEGLDFAAFENPSAEFRPVPFWGLNDDLADETLRDQVREMKDKGWGGFFMHARYGLETPYLGPTYMERVKSIVEEAKKQGIKAWIYDEHPFPAGTAGGLVTAPHKDFRHKALVMRMHNRLTPIDPSESLGYFEVALDQDGVPTSVKPLSDPETYTGRGQHFMHFYLWTEPLHQAHQPGFSNYDDNIIHGFATSDNLNPKAVRKFIDVTYENFKSAVGEDFGATLEGGFSDIPVYHWNYATPHPSIPWTTGFEDYFKKEAGYDILPLLPSLFFDLGEYHKVRVDYWRAVNKLFVESFTKQLYQWHEQHGLKYIAHYWGEETLHWQVPWTGDAMSHFVYHHYVGMDHSIRNIEDPLGIKQAATVAEQLGKSRMAAETYGMSGNNLSHAERKWIGDWEYALGANFLIPYVALYSFRGRRKRDEPASLFVQQAYWQYERLIYDYYGRLSYMLTRGKRAVDILVLQPLTTAMAMYTPSVDYPQAHRPDPLVFEGSTAELYAYNQNWMNLCDDLLSRHRDFHLGNEAIMAEFARVEGAELHVGQHAYKAVVVPPSLTWSESTLQLLHKFAAAGGVIIAVRPLPTLVDGAPSGSVLPTATRIVDGAIALEEALSRVLNRDIVLADNADILYQHRVADGQDIYFIANTSLTKHYLGEEIAIPGDGAVELWDATTGARHQLPVSRADGKLTARLDLYPTSSYLLVRTSRPNAGLPSFRPLPSSFANVVELGDEWTVEAHDPNVLVVDYAQVKIGDGPWTECLPMWKAYRVVKQGGIGAAYTVRYSFRLAEKAPGLSLLMENPENLQVRINGEKFETEGDSWWLDPHMRTFAVSHALKVGENVIDFIGRIGVGTEVECCLIVGDLTVDRANGFIIAGPTRKLEGRDITAEGYPFFTGRVSFRKDIEIPKPEGRVFLNFDRVDATLARVHLNGRLVGSLPWQPYTLDITDAIKPGRNELEIELVTTRHNLFGPHHDKRGEVTKFAAPHIWANEVMWTDDYYFAPLGVTGAKIGTAAQ